MFTHISLDSFLVQAKLPFRTSCLSDSSLKSMSGLGQHTACVAAVLLFATAILVKTSELNKLCEITSVEVICSDTIMDSDTDVDVDIPKDTRSYSCVCVRWCKLIILSIISLE